MSKPANLCVMTVASAPGTGASLTLSAAVAPFLTMAQAGIADGDIVSYGAIDAAGGQSENGYGLVSGSALVIARNVNRSTGAGNTAKPSLGAGTLVHITQSAEDAQIPAGQCRLDRVSTNLALSRCDGKWLFIAGGFYEVPSSAPTLSASGASASTLYYIYAFMSSGTLTLERSTTAPATDATFGHKIKNGDATRSLVGMANTDGSSAWALCASYFNRRNKKATAVFTANRTVSSATYAEFNSEIRTSFLTWSDEDVFAQFSGAVLPLSVADTGYAAVSFDSTTSGEDGNAAFNGTSTIILPTSVTCMKSGLSEGLHYATLIGKATSAAGLLAIGNATQGQRGAMYVMVRN